MEDSEEQGQGLIGRLSKRLMSSERWRERVESGRAHLEARQEQHRERLEQAFAQAPRNISWLFDVHKDEVRDASGALVMRLRHGQQVESSEGSKLVRVGGEEEVNVFSAVAHNPFGNDPDELWVVDAGRLVIARVSTGVGDERWFCDTVRLLPPGRYNDTFAAAQLTEEARSRIQSLTPLEYRLIAETSGELRGQDGTLLARDEFAHSMLSSAAQYTAVLNHWAIEVKENPLPGAWLLGVLRCIEILRGVQLRDRRPDLPV